MMKVVLTEGHLDDFERFRIFSQRTGMGRKRAERVVQRWNPGEALVFAPETSIEPYTTFAAGHNLYTMGSFSASASAFPGGARIGRFTEVAVGVETGAGWRHPMEAVSMASAVFNFARENIAPYFDDYERRTSIRLNPTPVPTPQEPKDISIGNDVWIGRGSVLHGGVSIGNGSIVASRSIVTKDVPPYALVAGVPARIRRLRFPEPVIRDFESLKYWDYELGKMLQLGLDFSNPKAFLSAFAELRSSLDEYRPKVFYPLRYFSLEGLRDKKIVVGSEELVVDCFGRILVYSPGRDGLAFVSASEVGDMKNLVLAERRDNRLAFRISDSTRWLDLEAIASGRNPISRESRYFDFEPNESERGRVVSVGIRINEDLYLGTTKGTGVPAAKPWRKEWEQMYLSNYSFPEFAH